MSSYNGCYRFNCVTLGVIASIVVGIVTAFLRITGTITITPVLLYVTLGIAVVYLAVLLLSPKGKNGCCSSLSALLVGIIGTILLSALLLAVTFVATSVIGAIITGLLFAFVFLIFAATACFIRCQANCTNNTDE